MILLVKDHVQERKESFYAKIKVSVFVNFLVRFEEEDDEEFTVWQFSVYPCSCMFYLL